MQEPPVLPGLLLQQLQQVAASSRIAAALVILQWLHLAAGAIRKQQQPETTALTVDQAAAASSASVAPAAVEASTSDLAAAIAQIVPEQLPDSCLVYLSAPGPSLPSYPLAGHYSELGQMYARMRKDLTTLLNSCLQVGHPRDAWHLSCC